MHLSIVRRGYQLELIRHKAHCFHTCEVARIDGHRCRDAKLPQAHRLVWRCSSDELAIVGNRHKCYWRLITAQDLQHFSARRIPHPRRTVLGCCDHLLPRAVECGLKDNSSVTIELDQPVSAINVGDVNSTA